MSSISSLSYQVGIICALPKEKAAVRAVLDEEYELFQEQDAQDCNTYSLGRIHNHNVVVACLPAGVYGTVTAATVARDMLRTFPEIRIGLLVGIGGGVPDFQRNTIRLGDIVVSQPDRIHGGVVQYDLGKQIDGEFTRKGSLDKPPIALLAALSSLQAQHELSDSKVFTYMEKAYQKHSKLIDLGYSFPGTEKDVLYCTTCGSDRWWKILWLWILWLCTLWQCQICSNGLIYRQRRKNETPAVHYGIIAAGNSLIKDARIRDRLGQELGAKCIEMEAAGLMDHFRCIVIRGICDYADIHKNDEWQEYAALAAAALAKELLEFVTPTKVAHEKPLRDVCDILENQNRILQEQIDVTTQHLQEVKQQNQRTETRYLNESQRKCLQSFKTSAYSEYKESVKKAVPGTCQWALENDAFCRWRSSSTNDLLWISADPGCGKSVLAKLLVDEQLPKEGQIVCYFFFKDNGAQDNLSAALCALLHQLFDQDPRLIGHAMPAWEKNSADKLVHEIKELWTIFLSAASDPQSPNIICVLDALDECRDYDRDRLIEYLNQFYTTKSTDQQHWLKFIITSRPYDTIRDQLELSPNLPTIRVRGEDENDLIRKDINLVIEDHVQGLARRTRLSSKTHDRLRGQLLQMEHRTYLWLYLSIQSIEDAIRDNPHHDNEDVVTSLIGHLPATVEEAYEKILRRIEGRQNVDYVKSILKIVIGAKRPLTIGEMAIACGIATHRGDLITLKEAKLDVAILPEWIRRLTNLFTFINHSRIYLIHQTAKEFLVRKQYGSEESTAWKHSLKLHEIEAEMAYVCVHFLQLIDVGAVGEQLARKLENDSMAFLYKGENETESFILYSVMNWTSHYRDTSSIIERPSLKTVLHLYGFLEDSPKWWYKIRCITNFENEENVGRVALSIAASVGDVRIVDLLLRSVAQENVSGDCKKALSEAGKFGHREVVELVLDKWAGINASKEEYRGTLQAASNHDLNATANMLLVGGADVDTGSSTYGSALRHAAAKGHRDIVELLLDRGAEVNFTDHHYGNALQAACRGGFEDIIQLLLDRGANVNTTDQDSEYSVYFNSPLQEAGSYGHLEVIKLLLDRGADINAIGRQGSVLQVASSQGHQDTVKLLLDRGADIEQDGGADSEGSALVAASFIGHQGVVELLLDCGANVNATGIHGDALQAASAGGNEEIVRLLFDRGADVKVPGEEVADAFDTETPLDEEGGKTLDLILLFDEGDWFSKRGNKDPLQLAAFHGDLEIVELLLDRGAGIDRCNGYGSALHVASYRDELETVELLLDRGADVNAVTRRFQYSVMQLAAYQGSRETVELLLDRGADIHAIGPSGTALQIASRRRSRETIELLLARGAERPAPGAALHDQRPTTKHENMNYEMRMVFNPLPISLHNKTRSSFKRYKGRRKDLYYQMTNE